MLCAVVLRRIFVPQAKTILLVKQRLFHLFTDLTNTSYSLLRQIMTPSVSGGLRLVLSNTSKKTNQGIFRQFCHKRCDLMMMKAHPPEQI